jgi:hypothetical protein
MFQNTRAALQQLLYAMEEDGGALLEDMSTEERRAFDELAGMCEAYTEMAEDTLNDFEENERDYDEEAA